MRNLRRIWSTVLLSALVAACADSAPESARGEPGSVREGADASRTVAQGQTSDDRERWTVSGVGSTSEQVGPNGEPETATARFVNGGRGAQFGATSSNGWLVGATSGWVQLLDENSAPEREERQLFGGSGELDALVSGSGGWLAAGADGEVQEIDQAGQPEGTGTTAFRSAAEVTAAGYGNSNWMVGAADGRTVELNQSQLQVQERAQLGISTRIVEILFLGGKWYAFTENDIVEITSVGGANRETVAPNRTITAVTAEGSTVAVGANDGRVLVAERSNLTSSSWQNALEGEAVRSLQFDGQRWLAAGKGGAVRLLDSSGAPQGSVQTVAGGSDLSIARSKSDGWWVGLQDLSAIQSIDSSLSAPSLGADVLGGAAVREIVAYPEGAFAVGDGGQYRFLGTDGTPEGSVQQLEGAGRLSGVEWDGSKFMVVGERGQVATISPDGSVGLNAERLGGAELATVSWSSSFWLIVSASGTAQRLRPDGDVFRESIDTELDEVEYAEYNGDQWMAVGSKGGEGAFTILDVQNNGSVETTVNSIAEIEGTLRAAAYNGLNWLLGGDGGMVVRVDQRGSVISGGESPGMRNALFGQPVESIDFNGTNYLIGGGSGAVRHLEQDALPTGRGSLVNGFARIQSVEWMKAKGFPGGPCVADDFCFTGPCIGQSLRDAFCCESQCSGACQSCRGDVTGEADGTCAPIPEGDEPPEDSENDCVASPESSCGLNGACDGEGECAFHGSDVRCSDPSCQDGTRAGAGFCNGSGDCVPEEETSCSPYAVCAEGDTACATSCSSGDDCVEGFVCVEGECISSEEQMNPDAGEGTNGNGGDGGGDGGCSTSGRGTPLFAPIFVVLVGLARRRRRDE